MNTMKKKASSVYYFNSEMNLILKILLTIWIVIKIVLVIPVMIVTFPIFFFILLVFKLFGIKVNIKQEK